MKHCDRCGVAMVWSVPLCPVCAEKEIARLREELAIAIGRSDRAEEDIATMTRRAGRFKKLLRDVRRVVKGRYTGDVELNRWRGACDRALHGEGGRDSATLERISERIGYVDA